MTWQELIHDILTDSRLYVRALGFLVVGAVPALLVFLVVLLAK